jgi:hypothetical protein
MIETTKNWFAPDAPHIRFLCIIFLVAALNVFVRLSFLPLTLSTDAYSYMDSARLVSGEIAEHAYPGRLLKPLAPIGIAFFAQFLHGDMVAGFLALNILCYFLLGIVIYTLLLLFTTDRMLAMLGAIMFLSAYPMLEYGLNLYSEMGTWALYVLALLGAIRYYRDASWKNFSIAAGAVVVGLLWKEYAVPAGIFFGLVILFEPMHTWKEKFTRMGVLGILSLIVVSVAALIVYELYQYTYIDWFREAALVDPAQSEHSLYFIGKSLFAVFLLGWGLVLAGLLNWKKIPHSDRWVLALLFPPSMMFLLWTFVSSRLYYIVAPLLSIIALHGLATITDRRSARVLLVAIIMLGSYAWLFASGTLRVFLQ